MTSTAPNLIRHSRDATAPVWLYIGKPVPSETLAPTI